MLSPSLQRRVITLSAAVLSALFSHSPARAFDYLEHLYLTDSACQEALSRLSAELDLITERERRSSQRADEEPQALTRPSRALRSLQERTLALALLCPLPDERPYCAEGQKLALGALTPLAERPEEGGDYSLTLGDLAALPDHIAEFGELPQVPRASKEGLMTQALLWIAQEDGGVDGTLEDVAEDACEGGELVDWSRVKADLRSGFEALTRGEPLPSLRREYLSAHMRAPLRRGPSDPAGLYSFDNPHYLDLVFRNHHHFGEHAYSAWLGFHGVAIDLAALPCEALINPDPDLLEELADDWPSFEGLEWGALELKARRREGCLLLEHIIEARLEAWSAALSPQERARWHERLGLRDELITGLVSPLLSLIFEGSGLHFLQDSLAGGHMRTIRTRGGLQEARYDHDADNRHGVVAAHVSQRAETLFVAYGDSYILGFGPEGEGHDQGHDQSHDQGHDQGQDPCQDPLTTERGARCALKVQRAVIGNSTLGSLIDWAHGGLLFEDHRGEAPDEQLSLVARSLPTSPPGVASQSQPPRAQLRRSDLPVPPPPFSYQSLSNRLDLDLAGGAPRLTLQLGLLDTLGSFAHWLTSYRMGLNSSLGSNPNTSWTLEGGYAFHFRWAARFTIDMGVLSYVGWRGFSQEVETYLGVAPTLGFTILPEGWVKMPLEVSVNYQLPLTMYDEAVGFPGRDLIEGHYLGVSLGLAFMR